ncbi:MAG: energy-coupling factor transport system substrate-specific component, partial [Thermoleophilaceae bacterium]|nr:energy-coupling factor transport system substrate-specific component [Thermoleophilaceae bacterium]
WKGNNGWTAFGVLALKATGGSGVGRSAHWLARQQNRDGGFGFRPAAVSDVDDTGAALQALAAGGLRGSKQARRAVAFLRAAQNGDGGFAQMRGGSSNAQSTSWAVQGIVATRRTPDSFKRSGRSPLRYLRSLQASDGSVRYSRASAQTPVWVTAQALDALEKKAFPLAAARSRAPARSPRVGGGSGQNSGNDGGTGRSGAPSRPKVAHKRGSKPSPPPPASVPAPAPAAGPTGPTGSSGPVPVHRRPTALTPGQRAAMQLMRRGAGGSAWLPVAIVAGVAALALWRRVRRRQPGV